MQRKRQRRYGVELYFVLYLTALLLLLPDHPATESPDLEPLFYTLIRNSFDLVPDKNPVVLQLQRTAAGWRVQSGDSTNQIGVLGNVEILDINCIPYQVESQGQLVRFTRSASSLPFSLFPDTLLRRILFVLHPSQQSQLEPATFRILLSVTAKPRITLPANVQDPVLQRFAQWLRNRNILLRDSVAFTLQLLPESPVPSLPPLAENAVAADTTPPAPSQPSPPLPIIQREQSAKLTARVATAQLHALQGEQWTNTIYLAGLEGTSTLPEVTLAAQPKSYQEAIQYQFLDRSTLLLSGATPSQDTLQVSLLLTSSELQQAVRLHFSVIPHQLPPPKVPQVMYPEIAYQFVPNFPLLSAQDIRAILRDSATIRYTSIRGTPFTFIPRHSDTNQIFIFERYVGNRRVGESIKIPVKPYPAPEIIEVVPLDAKFLLRVRTYGTLRGIANRSQIVLIDGKARIQERYGDYISIKETQEHIQTFELTPLQPNSTIRIQAVDLRGKHSPIVTITKP